MAEPSSGSYGRKVVSWDPAKPGPVVEFSDIPPATSIDEVTPAEPSNDLCFWHGYEPVQEGDYHLCGECWHVWRTQEDFARDVRAWLSEDEAPSPTPETVHACPLCAHDW